MVERLQAERRAATASGRPRGGQRAAGAGVAARRVEPVAPSPLPKDRREAVAARQFLFFLFLLRIYDTLDLRIFSNL